MQRCRRAFATPFIRTTRILKNVVTLLDLFSRSALIVRSLKRASRVIVALAAGTRGAHTKTATSPYVPFPSDGRMGKNKKKNKKHCFRPYSSRFRKWAHRRRRANRNPSLAAYTVSSECRFYTRSYCEMKLIPTTISRGISRSRGRIFIGPRPPETRALL